MVTPPRQSEIDVRLRMFTWLTDRAGLLAVSRMTAEDVARARSRRLSHNVVTSRVFGPLPRDVTATDRTADTDAGPLTVRVYTPPGAAPDRPLVVDFHGGGGTLGNLDHSDWLCSWVASRVGAVVVSVDYRLAPEHPFPAGLEDGYAGLRWAVAHAEELGAASGRVAVMGDSAGGNLAAAVCLLAREAGPVIDAQILLYPVVDLRFSAASTDRFHAGPLLTRADMDVFRANYLGADGDAEDPFCSPLLAPDLSGLPPALVVTARIDPLHDDGVAYAARLEASGVPTRHRDHQRAVHGFLSFPGVCRAAGAALDEICCELAERLTPELVPTAALPVAAPEKGYMWSPPLTE